MEEKEEPFLYPPLLFWLHRITSFALNSVGVEFECVCESVCVLFENLRPPFIFGWIVCVPIVPLDSILLMRPFVCLYVSISRSFCLFVCLCLSLFVSLSLSLSLSLSICLFVPLYLSLCLSLCLILPIYLNFSSPNVSQNISQPHQCTCTHHIHHANNNR